MRFILILVLVAVCGFGCSQSGSGSSGGSGAGLAAAAIIGYDYSGTYITSRIECYNPSLTTLNTSGVISSGAETIVIVGNTFTSTIYSGACLVTFAGTIQFTSTGMNIPSRSVTSATGGGCTATRSIAAAPANTVSPTSSSVTYTSGQSLTSVSNAAYFRNSTTGDAAIQTTFGNGVSPSDVWVTVYLKQ